MSLLISPKTYSISVNVLRIYAYVSKCGLGVCICMDYINRYTVNVRYTDLCVCVCVRVCV